MAKQKTQAKTITLYSPKGTRVSVAESRADKLKAKGYTAAKPKAAS